LAFGYRVVGRLGELRALFLVAGEAHVDLGRPGQHPVLVHMVLVAGRAGEVGGFVLAAAPQRPLGVLLVAAEACAVELAHRHRRLLVEDAIWQVAGGLAYVRGARPVASYARRGAGIRGDSMRVAAVVRQILLVVALDTGSGGRRVDASRANGCHQPENSQGDGHQRSLDSHSIFSSSPRTSI